MSQIEVLPQLAQGEMLGNEGAIVALLYVMEGEGGIDPPGLLDPGVEFCAGAGITTDTRSYHIGDGA
jgi:hypothetical protein